MNTTALDKLARTLAAMREMNTNIEAQIIALLVDVAQHPGTSQAAIIKRIGGTSASVSRTLYRLGIALKGNAMVSLEPMEDRRVKAINLTPKGTAFIARLIAEINS